MNKRKKVCFIVANKYPLPAVRGGAVEQLIDFFVEENEIHKKVDLTCISIYDTEAEKKSKKYKNSRFEYIPQKLLGIIPIKRKENFWGKVFRYLKIQQKTYFGLIYKKLKKANYDLIVIEGGLLHEYNYLKNRLSNIIFVSHLHGQVNGHENLSFYDFHIAISNFVKESFISNKIIPEKKVKVLLNAIDYNAFTKKLTEKEELELKAKYGIYKDEKVLLFCGRTIPEKGVKELIEAFKMIEQLDKTKLIIVGNANFGYKSQTEYESQLAEISKGLKDKIIFTGFILNTELYKIFNISDIGIFPSLWEEAFGMTIVEAMASSLPVIVTNTGALPEITSPQSAVLVDIDENISENIAKAINNLLSNDNKRLSMGKEGCKLASKYTIENYYKNYVKIIDEITKNR